MAMERERESTSGLGSSSSRKLQTPHWHVRIELTGKSRRSAQVPSDALIAVATWVHGVHWSLQVWDPSHMPKGKGKGRRPDLKLAMKLAETPDPELTSRPQPGRNKSRNKSS